MNFLPFRSFWFVAALVVSWTVSVRAENWPDWRGPAQNGVSRETGLPVTWDNARGIVWQCKLPEWGSSTPIIWGDALFLTSHEDDRRLLLVKIDKRAGKIVWTRQVGVGSAPQKPKLTKSAQERRRQEFHRNNNMASPSPVTDGERVVVHFGNGDLAAYDFEGNRLWKRNLQEDHGAYSIWWGHANSPILWGDLVLSICIQDSCRDLGGEPSPSYVVAHDKRTGEMKWKTPRPTDARAEHGDSYTTPVLWRDGDRTELVVFGGQMLDAYDPATGRRIWSLGGLTGNRTITGPVIDDNLVYVTQGQRKPLLAVKLGGQGEQPRERIVWQLDRGTPDSSTPVVWNDLLFFVTNDGIAQCLDAADGTLHWKKRIGGQHRASPLAAEGRIYFLDNEGHATVVAASAKYEPLAQNTLDDRTFASPAASDGKLFIRGRKWLYCLGE